MTTLLALVACVPPTRTPSLTGTTSSPTGDTGTLGTTGDTGAPAPICATVALEPDDLAVPGPASLDDSLAAWQALKAAEGDDYAYVDHYQQYSEYTTVIVVIDDVVTERCFLGYLWDEWVEVGADVGSHEHYALPLTMEEVYARCEAEIVPLDPEAYDYVTVDYRADGTLRHCVAFPYDCYDDCEFGYRVSSLTWL